MTHLTTRISGLVATTAKRPMGLLKIGLSPLRRTITRLRIGRYDRLHLGSGARLLGGWANIDLEAPGAMSWDLRKPLPITQPSIRLIYAEHFIEHIPRADALRLFGHLRRVMLPDGVLRVSTPDLRKLAEDYLDGRVVQMDHGGWYPETPCQMINEGMRLWGHTHIYDEPELVALLHECGFTRVRRVACGQSDSAELQNLESRPDFGDLIVEARA